jgi:hypothetical protein
MAFSSMQKKVGSFLGFFRLKKIGTRIHLWLLNQSRDLERNARFIVIPYLAKKRAGSGCFAIDLDSDWLGLGARIIKTLEILLYCEEKSLIPRIRYSYRAKPTADYFGELFYYKSPEHPKGEITYTKIRDIDELRWPENYNQKLRLDFAKKLFDKYLGIREDIVREVDVFCEQWFKGKRILGVHYRGTDKAGEAPVIDKERLLESIREVVEENNGINAIFLSSDDEQIIRFLEDAALGLPLIYRKDKMRSGDGQQFHRKKEISKSIVNRDALVNCLLLSRCHLLLKTASILSDCSVVFNPELPVEVISFPHSDKLTWWPATEIKQRLVSGNYAIAQNK